MNVNVLDKSRPITQSVPVLLFRTIDIPMHSRVFRSKILMHSDTARPTNEGQVNYRWFIAFFRSLQKITTIKFESRHLWCEFATIATVYATSTTRNLQIKHILMHRAIDCTVLVISHENPTTAAKEATTQTTLCITLPTPILPLRLLIVC